MLRDEAEREAERRNHEEPDRARYEFYAFDESAGMAEDAWDVAARLREGPPPTAEWPGLGPQTPAGGAPRRRGDGHRSRLKSRSSSRARPSPDRPPGRPRPVRRAASV